ncbi:MAG TPA: transketolase [Bacteroidota bacterium]|nr:transketolase [Bacteroidota bacterium]
MNLKELEVLRHECLREVLYRSREANAGHIGTSLSCLDILVYLYFNRMREGDRFVLSKGHAALAFYVVLSKAGIIDASLLDTFYANGTLLAAHPPCSRRLPGVDFGTGSLGHGLSLANGFAFSGHFTGRKNNVYCLLSDGDCDEGSTWEAALFAAHHRLENLTVIVDNNNLQGFGRTDEVMNLEPLADKWRSFNFSVAVAARGNDFASIDAAFAELDRTEEKKPRCLIARTVKGSGVSFMENRLEWHYLPMSDEQYARAIEEIERT